jgi:hypothetical protein
MTCFWSSLLHVIKTLIPEPSFVRNLTIRKSDVSTILMGACPSSSAINWIYLRHFPKGIVFAVDCCASTMGQSKRDNAMKSILFITAPIGQKWPSNLFPATYAFVPEIPHP